MNKLAVAFKILKEIITSSAVPKVLWTLIGLLSALVIIKYFDLSNVAVPIISLGSLLLLLLGIIMVSSVNTPRNRKRLSRIVIPFVWAIVLNFILIVTVLSMSFVRGLFDENFQTKPNDSVKVDTVLKYRREVPTRKLKYVHIIGVGKKQILNSLRKLDRDYRESVNAITTLQVTFSGEIEECPDCIYGGGYVVIKVNGITCHEFREYFIPKTYDVNENGMIEEFIDSHIQTYIEENPDEFVKAIVQNCSF